MERRVILHCDMNNFYASVECMKNPSLKDKPLAVCGDVEERQGIVLAKNYAAKAFGVQTAEAVWQAKIKCPHLITVPPDFACYVAISRRVVEIYKRYTDMIEPFGLDECWLDVTGSRRLFGDGEEIGYRIKEEIKKEIGITASVGVSFNKIFAKLGSDMKKPDGLTVISFEDFKSKIWHLPACQLMGVGGKTELRLKQLGISTIGQLANFPPERSRKLLGKWGDVLWKYANGLDDSPVETKDLTVPDKSLGHGMTARRDLVNEEEVWQVMLELCQEIGTRLYYCNKKTKAISINLRDSQLSNKQWQKQLDLAIQSPYLIAKEAFSLFKSQYDWHLPVRAVSVAAIKLICCSDDCQINIFEMGDQRVEKIDNTILALRQRYGDLIIRNGCLINNSLLNHTSPPGFGCHR